MSDARTLATTYLDAWQRHDFDTLRTLLADDVTFAGPMGRAEGVEECVAGLQGMTRMMTGIDVAQMVVEGDHVMTWYDLHTTTTPPLPTVNWSHVRDGRIDRIRAVFDPRPLFESAE